MTFGLGTQFRGLLFCQESVGIRPFFLTEGVSVVYIIRTFAPDCVAATGKFAFLTVVERRHHDDS